METRQQLVTKEEFKALMTNRQIRPASLQDVEGIHHQRPLYQHPNTKQWWVAT